LCVQQPEYQTARTRRNQEEVKIQEAFTPVCACGHDSNPASEPTH